MFVSVASYTFKRLEIQFIFKNLLIFSLIAKCLSPLSVKFVPPGGGVLFICFSPFIAC